MLCIEISVTLSQNPYPNLIRHQFIVRVQPTVYCDVTMDNMPLLQCLTKEFLLRILNRFKVEGTEKVTRQGGGVNRSQSKFLTGTWPISQI
jgi:hypothetical protein